MANNTYVNKVSYVENGTQRTLIDLTADTVTAADVAQGKTFHLPSGAPATGTATGGAGSVYQDADGYLVLAEDGSTPVTVEALSVTANGTYTAPTGKAYSPVTVSVSGGGDTWSWMGRNPVKLATMPKEHSTFRDLGVDQWTWSTTQSTLRAAQDYADSVSDFNLIDYDVVLVYKVYIHYDYGDWTPVAAASEIAFVGQCYGNTYYTDPNSLVTGTPSAASLGGGSTSIGEYIYNSGGVKSFTNSGYGIYTSMVSNPSKSGAHSASVLTPKKPVIYARGSTSYFSETAFQNLDFDVSYYELECEVWRVDHGTSYRSSPVEESRDILINGGLGVTS